MNQTWVKHHKRSGEVDIGRGHEVQSLYRQQLMYYIISCVFVGITLYCTVFPSTSPPYALNYALVKS
jgi:hypothetical protein